MLHIGNYLLMISTTILLGTLANNHGTPLNAMLARDSTNTDFLETYLGVQEVDRDPQEEDEHEQGEQLSRSVRY